MYDEISHNNKTRINHDELRPYQEYGQEYLKLWQNILIKAARDAYESKKKSAEALRWIYSPDGMFICRMANISWDSVRKKFHAIVLWDDDSAEMLLNLSYFRSAHNQYNNNKQIKKGEKYNEVI